MRVMTGLALVSLLCPSAAWAQTPAPSGNPVADSIRGEWSTVERYMKESAELMDEANYSFKPVDSVRSFGAILAHVAGANYVFCAAAKGEKAPHVKPNSRRRDDEGRHRQGAERLVRLLRHRVHAERRGSRRDGRLPLRRRQDGTRRTARRQHRPQQRALRQSRHLLPYQGHRPALLAETAVVAAIPHAMTTTALGDRRLPVDPHARRGARDHRAVAVGARDDRRIAARRLSAATSRS